MKLKTIHVVGELDKDILSILFKHDSLGDSTWVEIIDSSIPILIL